MDDGRVITGLVNDRQDGKITLGLATGQQVTIDADAVEEEQMQAASLMPEGLISQLSTQEVSDLIERAAQQMGQLFFVELKILNLQKLAVNN